MTVTVHIPAPLQKWTKSQSKVEIADATSMDELIDGLENDYPGIKGKLVENGEIRAYIRVFLNDEDIRFMKDEGVRLLRYDTLTFSDGVSAAFTVGYRLEDRPEDTWSARFTKFKFDPDPASTEGGARLMAHAGRILAQGLGLNPGRTVFAPALRSSERTADPEGLMAMLASRCAGECRYEPGLLQKEVHPPTGRGGLYPEFRTLLVEQADYRSAFVDADTVVIVDDFVATGKTLSLAATAILERNPKVTVFGLALAKPEWHKLILDWHEVEISNDHIPDHWSSIWSGIP